MDMSTFPKMKTSRTAWWRQLRQDLTVFAHLYPWRVTIIMLIGLAALTYLFWWAHQTWQGEISPIKALFAIINMTFFQLTFTDMPSNNTLDIFPIIVPLIGLPIISLFGLRIVTIIRLFFIRSERGQEWQEAVVRYTVQEHIIICGLGRIGYRVARRLSQQQNLPLVGITIQSDPLVETLMAEGMPVILGNIEDQEILSKAGIERATIVIVCTDDDWTNLGTTVLVQKLNPHARVVLRLFEDALMAEIQSKFKLDAVISRSAVAATTFTYAAIGGEIVETFKLVNYNYILAQIPLGPTSPMLGRTIGEVAQEQDVTVVCHHRGQTLSIEPDPNLSLSCYDTIFVFTTVNEMLDLIDHGLEHDSIVASTGRGVASSRGKILVCGLGNIGYRVASNLQDLGSEVVALGFAPTRLSPRLAEQGIPLKFGDLRWNTILAEADIAEATAIVACTEDDMTNLQIALRARALNPTIRVVLRIFDDQLHEKFHETFGYNVAVYSTSALAAPTFVAAALNRMNMRMIELGGEPKAIVRLQIEAIALQDVQVGTLHQETDLTVLLHARNNTVNIPPDMQTRLVAGDEIVVMASEEKLAELEERNKIPAL